MIKNNKLEELKLNMQFFAEGEGAGEGQGEGSGEGTGQGEGTKKFELTEEELNKRIEAESDRKIESALKKREEKMRAEMEKEVKEREAEAARLASLSQKEREEAEFKKRQDALDKREQEIAQKELKNQAVTELHAKELPTSFADFLLADDGEKTFQNIGNFKTAFDDAVNAAVKEALRQDTPKGSTGGTSTSNPWKSGEVNLTEQTRIFKENPELAKTLMAQAK